MKTREVDSRRWLKFFFDGVDPEYEDYCRGESVDLEKVKDPIWTKLMLCVMDEVAKKTECHASHRRLPINGKKDEESCEYLGIDVMFFPNSAYDEEEDGSDWDPFVLPHAVAELENDPDFKIISYALWKLLCIRTPLRVLICYASNPRRICELKSYLTAVIRDGSLMKEAEGELLVIIGDESKEKEAEWPEYFNVYEWKESSLQPVRSEEF